MPRGWLRWFYLAGSVCGLQVWQGTGRRLTLRRPGWRVGASGAAEAVQLLLLAGADYSFYAALARQPQHNKPCANRRAIHATFLVRPTHSHPPPRSG